MLDLQRRTNSSSGVFPSAEPLLCDVYPILASPWRIPCAYVSNKASVRRKMNNLDLAFARDTVPD